MLAGGENEPHQFTGQEREPELGLTYMNGRWYASEFGRFLQVDPMDQFWNSYSYAGNNPINRNDPSGLYTAQEEAVMLANQAFRNGDEVAGYFWMGVSGFASTTDNVSKVFDHHFISQRDDVDGWTYAGAILEVGDIVPVGRIAKGFKSFFGIGKAGKAADTANDLKGAISLVDDVASETKGAIEVAKRTGCFEAGTLVWSEHGMVPVEDIRLGDKVWSRSDATGLLALKTVEQTFVYHDKETYLLRIEGVIGQQLIKATCNHPFWSEPGRWIELAQLVSGNRIWTESGWHTVVSFERRAATQTVYNFTVADFHSYFVGSQKTWVHNTDCDDAARAAREAAEKAAKIFVKHNDEAQKLIDIINYVGRDVKLKIPGGLIGAIKYTKETGKLVGDSDHVQKGLDILGELKKIKKRVGNAYHLPDNEKKALLDKIQPYIDGLQDALDGA